MNITIIGTGYIGLVQGVIMSKLGFNVICIDSDEKKVEILKAGKSPIYEPGLEEIMEKSIKNKKINFTNSYKEGLKNAEIIFLAVPTPAKANGSSNLQYIKKAAKDLGKRIEQNCMVITKSTVPTGTNREVKKIIKNELEKRKMRNLKVDIISNPEFLREGKAVYDFLNPDRIVVGIDEESNKNEIEEKINKLYEYFKNNNVPIVFTTLETAELAKYASNAFLSVKISFINEMAMLSEKVNANIEDISKIMGYDHRIGNEFLQAGLGFGGSCFPKDTLSILNIGKNNNCKMKIIDSAVQINEKIKENLVLKIENKLGNINGKIISILGLSFKPETDDVREAPAIKIIKKLIKLGANIKVYCPKGMENAKKELYEFENKIIYSKDEYDCVEQADCIILTTEWKQFSELDLEKIKKLTNNNYFFDFRNVFTNNEKIRSYFQYYSIGRN